MTWTQQSGHHGHTRSGSLIIMNNNIPVPSKNLSAEKLGTAFFWDMAQRDVPDERDPHDYPVLCNNTNPPWKAGKLLISGDFEDPLREQPPWNQDQNRTPPVQSNSRTTQDSKTETNRIHLKKDTKTKQLSLRFTTSFWIQVLWRGRRFSETSGISQ